MLSTVREAAAVGPSIGDVGTSITGDASTSDIATLNNRLYESYGADWSTCDLKYEKLSKS